MSGNENHSPIPSEIFAKILTHFKKKASHCDMQSLEKAIDHPQLDHLMPTFDFYTSRSKPERCEKSNFICPICLFSQPTKYDDSVWEKLCQSTIGCSFILHGGYGLVKTISRAPKPPSKRQFRGSSSSTSFWIRLLHSQELLMRRRTQSVNKDEFTQQYLQRIQSLQGDTAIIREISESKLQTLKIFTNVGEFIDHLNTCDSHYTRFSIKIKEDFEDQFPFLNFDYMHQSKIKGDPIEMMESPRCVMKKLTNDPEAIIRNMISLSQPEEMISDFGIQNHDFLEHILWPVLTLAISIQLEDHICYPTNHLDAVPDDLHRALALRDLLRCICEVFENLEYDFELANWMKAKFAAFHSMLDIIDSSFPDY